MRALLKFHHRLLTLLFLGLAAAGTLRAAGTARDALVFPDGDRVQGWLVDKTADTLIFQSDRFGLLRVPVGEAVVVPAQKPAEPADKPALAPNIANGDGTAETGMAASLTRLAGRLQSAFQPWSGRFAFSTEVVTDTANRSNLSFELHLQRKWRHDDVQLKARYDFNETDGRTTTDMLKADGLWRHDFQKKGFVLYRPAMEWSRASFRSGVPSDYFLMQQEIGAGLNVLATAKTKMRLGVSENLFDTWSLIPGGEHDSRTAESAFMENELKLPWSLLMAQRGVYYYSIATAGDGWENRLELTKKFTKTLSTAIRHEMRRGSPDGKSQDYTRLKLLFGVDF